MVNTVAQGEILRLEKPAMYVLVLSKDFFNRSGMAVVCPVFMTADPDALHLPVFTDGFSGIALLEQLRALDLRSRYFSHIGQLSFGQIQEVSDAVQSIFEYYPYTLL